jgi:hypothetical protein
MSNPLDPILAWYTTAADGLRVTRRVVQKAVPGVITRRHVFHNRPRPECEAALDLALGELGRLVVLALTATFERAVRDYLRTLPAVGAETGDPHQDAVRDEVLNDLEMWNLHSRVIDLFTGVDANLRGQVKQIVKYRNWVAHGRTTTDPAPVATDPADAHNRLTEFLKQAKVI